MEVVKTGEALEKQVLEDARTKASRVLAEADRECEALREEWRRRTEADIRRVEADRDVKIAAVRQELGASLPLDFMRARLSHIQESVGRALEEFFARLAPEDLGRFIGGMMQRMPPVFKDTTVVVHASGIRPQDAKRIVEENVPGIRVEAVKDAADGGPDAGIVLETTDGHIRFRGTVRELSAQLLEQYREEMATALLGRDV